MSFETREKKFRAVTHRCPHISCQLIFFPSLFSFYHPPSLPHWCELLLARNAGAHGMVMSDEVKFMDGWIEREGFGFSGRGVGAAEEAAARSKPSGLVLTTWDSVCVCACVCYCITTIASMSLSSSDRVFCRWEDFLLYFWQWLNRSKQVCLHAFMCLCFSLTFLQKCRTEITKKRSRLLF